MTERIELDQVINTVEVHGPKVNGEHPLVGSLTSMLGVPLDRSEEWFEALCVSLKDKDPGLEGKDLTERALQWLQFKTGQTGL